MNNLNFNSMVTSEFIVRLKENSPTIETLTSQFGREVAKTLIEGYHCVLKDKDYELDKNPLIELFKNYDTRKLQIGLIKLSRQLSFDNNYVRFGNFMEDRLALRMHTNEIVTIDLHDPETILLHCSKDADAFLEIFVLYAKYNTYELTGSRYTDLDKQEIAQKLLLTAGGEKYKNFVYALLNYSE